MESAFAYSLIAVLLVSLVSLVGLAAFSLHERLLKRIMVVLVGLAAGALLGDAFIHLIPESFELIGDTRTFALAIISGIVFFLILEKGFRWHHAHHGREEEHEGHEIFETGPHPHAHLAPLVIVADGIHNLIDGVLIATSFIVSPSLGVATTIAVLFHEIPQEIADFGLLIHSGLSRTKALLLNFASALTAFIGVFLVFMASDLIASLIPLATAFTAGGFIYIAAVDLIPELQKNSKAGESVMQLIAFIIGIGIMYALAIIE